MPDSVVEKLEPETVELVGVTGDDAVCWASIAISLKRLADAAEGGSRLPAIKPARAIAPCGHFEGSTQCDQCLPF